MIVGFTGTRLGMTQKQYATVRYLLGELLVRELHHGDCIGADEQAFRLARRMGIKTVAHPPEAEIARAFTQSDVIMEPKPYLLRNLNIVVAGTGGLIAAPATAKRPRSFRGQGTWSTLAFAEKNGRRTWLVLPDGTFTETNTGGQVR